MERKPPETRSGKRAPYNFKKIDRERLKNRLRPLFKSFMEKMMVADSKVVKSRTLQQLGPDWQLLDEADDRHNVLFPLRTDVDLRKVKTAVDSLFPDEAANLKKNILDCIKRQKREKRKRDRGWARFTDTNRRMEDIWSLFVDNQVAGKAQFKILTPDAESRARWEKNLGGREVESFRVPASTTSVVVSELLDEEFSKSVLPKALEMRFKKRSRRSHWRSNSRR
jgi:hypothetical protein